jgi:hypothetical protein
VRKRLEEAVLTISLSARKRGWRPGDRFLGQDAPKRNGRRLRKRLTSPRPERIDELEHVVRELLVSPEDRTILGVHVLGTNATEVVHIGQTVMGFGGTIDYLVDAVFNYPTLAESYKVAALDARNRPIAVERLAQ